MNASLIRRLFTLSALASTLFPSAAAAGELTVGGAATISWAFGASHPLGWGLELHSAWLLQGDRECRNFGPPPVGVGVTTQIGGRGSGAGRLVIAAIAGAGRSDAALLDGAHVELGAAVPLGEIGEPGLHGGVVIDGLLSHVAVRTDPRMGEPVSVGIGPQFPGPMGPLWGCELGRPARGDDGRPTTAAPRGEPARSCIGAAWAEDARTECDSITSFLCLAAELLALGANDRLVDAALSAAADEMGHAASAAALPLRLGGARIWPALPPPPVRSMRDRPAALRRLAVESFVDGVVGEGAAADEARLAARRARHPEVVAHHHRVAREERRHAWLGAAVVRWALAEGGEPVRDALTACVQLERPPPPEGEALPDRLSSAERGALGRARSDRARSELAALLAA